MSTPIVTVPSEQTFPSQLTFPGGRMVPRSMPNDSLSLRDKQYQYLESIYGSGLSYNDMLHMYLADGQDPAKSISDLEKIAYGNNSANSVSDEKYALLETVVGQTGLSMSELEYLANGDPNVGSAIDNLMSTTPFYVAHRGSGDIWPEHTAVGYSGSLAAGIKAIEVSAQRSSDGWWFCLHDSGVDGLDRTTNGTGDPLTFTRAQLEALVVDIANCGPYWPAQNLRLPDLQTVLASALADPQAVVFLESKDYSGPAIDDILAKLALWFPNQYQKQIIWKSHYGNASGFTKAGNVGLKRWAYIDISPGANLAQQVTDALSRAEFIGIARYDGGNGLTDAEVDTVMGMVGSTKVICWQPTRRSEMALLSGKGVHGFVSPQAPYANSTGPNRTQDDFASGKVAPGDIAQTTGYGFDLNSGTAYFGTSVSNPSTCMGSMSPTSQYYEIEFELMYETTNNPTMHSGIAFARPNDSKYVFQNASMPYYGYLAFLRQNGQLQLNRTNPNAGSGTSLGGTIATPALVAGSWAKIRVRVDASGLSVQRMDGTPSTIITSTDNNVRGPYFHLTRNHGGTDFVRFRNVKVTEL